MTIKSSIMDIMRRAIPNSQIVKGYLKKVKDQFSKRSKSKQHVSSKDLLMWLGVWEIGGTWPPNLSFGDENFPYEIRNQL